MRQARTVVVAMDMAEVAGGGEAGEGGEYVGARIHEMALSRTTLARATWRR
jgi:hypothetical protein